MHPSAYPNPSYVLTVYSWMTCLLCFLSIFLKIMFSFDFFHLLSFLCSYC
jgi:hypothetical protein